MFNSRIFLWVIFYGMIDFFLVYIYVDDCFFVNMKFSEFKNDYKLYYILRSLFFSDILFYVLS